MSQLNPYEQLGVKEDASFEEIQVAKQRLIQQNQHNQQLLTSIETAYDAILMDRLKLRQEGKIKVPEGIRFPEKIVNFTPNFTPPTIPKPNNWLGDLIDQPTKGEILTSTVVYGGLTAVSFLPDFQDTGLSLLIAVGVGSSLYFLNRKEGRFGRALLISLGTLVVGTIALPFILGSFGFSPLDFNISANRFYTLVTLAIMWFISNFIK